MRQRQTPVEQRLWQVLRNRQLGGYKFHRQFVLEQYIVGFVCRSEKLIVELDGLHHAEENQVEYDQSVLHFLSRRATVCCASGTQKLKLPCQACKQKLPQLS